MDTWVFNWFFWLAGFFLAFELYAALTHQRTLSAQTWNWFSLGQRKRYWQARRAIFAVFWILLGIHFYFQAPALYTVILPGIPFAAVIVLSTFVWKDATTGVDKEQSSMKSIFGKIWSALKGAGAWTLRRGPLWSALITGAAIAFPAAAPVLTAIGGALGMVTGAPSVSDPEMGKAFGELLAGGLLFVGALRKFWKIAKPMLAPPAGK